MTRIKHCAFCGEPQKQEPCETCGADEEKIHEEMVERESREFGRRLTSRARSAAPSDAGNREGV